MNSGKVEICGINTAALPVLSDERKFELLRLAKSGDQNARRELIDGNLRLVLSIVKRFSSRRENADDLFQVGCIGLIKAVDNFNLELDVKFSTYAVPMIIGEVRRYLRDSGAIRVSRSVRDLAYRALQAREKLSHTMSAEPTVEQIAGELGESVEAVANAVESVAAPVSLYEPAYSDAGDGIYVMDQIKDVDQTDDAWLESIALKEAMKKLSERELKIVSMRFFKGKTQMEIAAEIGISQAQVSRIEKGALERIKKGM